MFVTNLRTSFLLLLSVASASKIFQQTGDVEVRKPVTDKRTYTYKTLDSGLRVLLVQDPDAQKSSYAMSVEVGSIDDPPDFQGLAHFCEHMVFLGSKKYPEEDSFSKELALYGGSNNAYTASDQTVYFAEVGHEGFQKTFDIFAHFFIDPMFASSMVDKEVNAVDSEHKKNMPDTQRRLWHLLRSKANPKSPLSKFSTGDLKTLKLEPEKQGKSLAAALEQFHSKNYCPSRMHLVMMSNSSAEDLLKIARKSFDTVKKDSCEPRPIYEDTPTFSHDLGNLGRSFTVHTAGSPQLWLQFPTVSLRGRYKEQADLYVNYALNHYGPGGLKALLKEKDLSLGYSAYFETTPAGSMFFVTFSLTENGAKNTDKVMKYFFAYMNSLRAQGVNKDILEKLQGMNQVSFDYQERSSSESDFVTSLAGALTSAPAEDVLTSGALLDKINLDLTREVLGGIAPDNMNVALVSPGFDEKTGKEHEQYYDFNYAEKALDPKLIETLQKASGFGLKPPPSLLYVPKQLALIDGSATDEMPERLESGVELWWLGLGRFKVPKALIQMKLGYPRSAVQSASRHVLAAMHSRLVNMALEKPSDALQMCGLSYSVSSGEEGMSISFSGFDEHLIELVRLVLPVVRQPHNPSEEFEVARRQFILDVSDITKAQPYQHAMEAFDLVTMKGGHSRAALLKAAHDTMAVSPSAHEAFIRDIFSKPTLTLLVAGNLDRKRSREITEEAKSLLLDSEVKPSKGFLARIVDKFIPSREPQRVLATDSDEDYPFVLKPKKELEIRVPNPIPDDPNSATIVAYQFGIPTLADRVRFSMISGLIDRPVFDVLRTQHQLGYVVFGFVTAHRDILEVRVLVQGFRETPDVVEELIESTVQNLTSQFANLDDKEFEVRKASLRSDLVKPPANLASFAGKFWGQIWDKTYCFDKAQREVRFMDGADFQSSASLLDAWKQTVSSKNRKKLAVKLFGADPSGKLALREMKNQEDHDIITDVEHTTPLSTASYWPHEYLCK
mmetsp:Transcript_25433/g.46173  ORF Transcript_25433/g.46173 Transcript_25433/m.46173 type:complete len:1008 (+) Transcript_25433:55-3078(+)